MKNIAYAALALSLFCLFGARAVAAPATPAEIQRALDARVSEVPNSGIEAVVVENGKATYYHAGVSGNARPMDERTLFEIGSVTKTFTSTVLAKMVEQGKVRLTDPVQKYLPATAHVPTYHGRQITLLDLATQHSGLPRLPSNMEAGSLNPYAAYDQDKLYAFLNAYHLTRAPGEEFEYSNLGVGLLGFALARANNMSYEKMIDTYVFKPLNMSGSAIALNNAEEKARLARGNDGTGEFAPPWDFGEPMVGAGGIRSDITDMTAYLGAVMGQGVLGKTLVFAEQPRTTLSASTHIGLVWWTNDKTGNINHGGDTAGYHSYVVTNADRSRGVVLLSNGPAVTDVAEHILDAASPISAPQKSIALSDAQLDEYVGTYKNAGAQLTYIIIRSGKTLDAQIVGQPSTGIYASSPDHFYYKIVPAYIEFIRDQGKVVGLILTQSGRTIPAYRIGSDGKALATDLKAAYPPVVNLDDATLQSYVGAYNLGGAKLTVTLENGLVFAQIEGQAAYQVFPSAKDAFYYKVVDAQLHFNRDADGKVTGLTLFQNGRELPAPKLP